jgi:nucleotide-binding universal stress UspA family protein
VHTTPRGGAAPLAAIVAVAMVGLTAMSAPAPTSPPPGDAPVVAGFCPSSADRAPVDFAVTAARFSDAPLVIVAVQAGHSIVDRLTGGEFGAGADDDGEAVERLRADLASRGVDATIRSVEHSSPARGIAHAVQELQARLVVLGSTRRGGVGHVLLGSTAERIIHGSPCPVLVVPHGHEAPEPGLQTVGAAFVPTPEGREALRVAAELARSTGARLRTIMVLSPHHAEEQSPGLLAGQHHETDVHEEIAGRHRLEAEQALSEAVAELADGVEVDVDVLFQDPADGVVAASRLVDLLVMGSRSYGPMRAVMLGGVARQVTARAACPVLVLPRA